MHRPQYTRRVIRFPLVAQTVFWWADRGVVNRSEGQTRDISEKGAFVRASTCPPEGIEIGFKVFLPPLVGSEQKTRVEAEGHVLRVERVRGHEECEGFAVLIEHMLLRVNDDIVHGGGNLGSDLQLS